MFLFIGTPHYSLTRFCLSSIVKQVATMAPSPRPKGDISETTFIELTHAAIDFLAKSANILESAVDLNDSSSVDKFLASAHCHASVRALLHSFRTESPLAPVLRLFPRISAPTAPREITSRDSPKQPSPCLAAVKKTLPVSRIPPIRTSPKTRPVIFRLHLSRKH